MAVSGLGSSTAADAVAARNWAANLAALATTQKSLAPALASLPAHVQWLYGRDGALTAQEADGAWWTGCSVPHRAATAMLKSLEARGNVSCFLHPAHPAQLQVALEMLPRHHAVIAVVPDMRWLRIGLSCCDFASDIRRHRLWLACGPDWQADLTQVFAANPGLATPQQFIRTVTLAENESSAMIAAAQKLFADEGQRRAALTETLKERWRQRPGRLGRLCVVVNSGFRLWEDDGHLLLNILAGGCTASPPTLFVHVDPDDPSCSSGLALAAGAAECDGVVSINAGRADLPAVLPDDMPLVTWVTTPRIPPFNLAGPRDSLLLADGSWWNAALKACWPAQRLAIAGRPTMQMPPHPHGSTAHIAIIADTIAFTATPEFEYSSHRLLWDQIRGELLGDPLAFGADVPAYLASRMKRAGISDQGFDRRRFVDELIVPAYQQGLARLLATAGIPLRLWGKGWDKCGPLGQLSCGEVNAREELHAAAAGARGLMHAWPMRGSHPIDALGRPVIHPFGHQREQVLRQAKAALSAGGVADGERGELISADKVVAMAG